MSTDERLVADVWIANAGTSDRPKSSSFGEIAQRPRPSWDGGGMSISMAWSRR